MDLILRVSARRFAEILITHIIISVIVAGIVVVFERTKIASNNVMLALLITSIIAYVIVTVAMSRRCFFDLIDRKKYYITNILAYVMFMIVNVALYFLLDSVPYTWLFAITKSFRYISPFIGTKLSILIFHTVMLGFIAAAPIGMDWLFDMDDDEYTEEY